jgi:hypothetical protein
VRKKWRFIQNGNKSFSGPTKILLSLLAGSGTWPWNRNEVKKSMIFKKVAFLRDEKLEQD